MKSAVFIISIMCVKLLSRSWNLTVDRQYVSFTSVNENSYLSHYSVPFTKLDKSLFED